MKKIVIVILLVALSVFTGWYYIRHPIGTTVTINNTVFTVDVAITPKEKEIGLGFRNSLAHDHGMLFVYTNKERFPFWMRNMHFPIDILWIDDRTIVDISKNVPTSDKPVNQLPIYHPTTPVDKVLELPAGTVDRVGILVGDRIIIKS